MGHPMRLELTLAGLLVKLANHYTTRGAHATSLLDCLVSYLGHSLGCSYPSVEMQSVVKGFQDEYPKARSDSPTWSKESQRIILTIIAI